ncbi:dr1-associated corepressor isoform X1 [Pygocentrus nattereri]|uniref:Transcription factor CBF/NF-Y/archaeal histone domain-containing protein n=1 Tax=Pygocentrus nattereri TaxID=42514 RepID=A0AAR2LF39_PYGNA|nr:dr1-associated corepressor isoform X1 [Pygocentrus nattereri]
MPGQKRKYNVRFPPGRIKKIMQKDTEVGRMATAVPVIISKALEMFLISFLTKTSFITQSKNSRVMSVNHMKQCIESEKLFDFLKDLAEQACGASTPKEGKPKGKCPGHRSLSLLSAWRPSRLDNGCWNTFSVAPTIHLTENCSNIYEDPTKVFLLIFP